MIAEGVKLGSIGDHARLPDYVRVLVVDDEPAIRLLAQRALQHKGYQVDVAADGQEALDRLLQFLDVGDGRYRLYACDVCRRYLKAYDVRQGGRPLMLSVDSVATLPLDAAAVSRGYRG